MITQTSLDFLLDLKNNNHRDWFHSHKQEYLQAKEEFQDTFISIALELIDADTYLQNVESDSHFFRINRDVRFSKDKSPYKTNFGAFISPGGRKMMQSSAGYYLHIEPNNSFFGGGVHMPDPKSLGKIRDSILENTNKFKSIIKDPKHKKYYDNFDETNKLKTAPRGYDKNDPNIDLIRYKSYSTIHFIFDSKVVSKNFRKIVLDGLLALKPMNDFFNQTLLSK